VVELSVDKSTPRPPKKTIEKKTIEKKKTKAAPTKAATKPTKG
jgi:hypothetical protein